MNRAVKLLGIFLEAVALLGLLGWLQAGDPDCVLEAGTFAQIRLCAPEIAGEPEPAPLLHLAIIAAIFLAGLLCLGFDSRPPARKQHPDAP